MIDVTTYLFSTNAIRYSRVHYLSETVQDILCPIYNTMLSIPIKFEQEFFVPTICIPRFIELVNNGHIQPSLTQTDSTIDLIYPLYNTKSYARTTPESIINQAITSRREFRIIRIDVPSKHLTYYGGRGLILDSKLRILFISGFIVKYNHDENKFYIEKPICYVDKRTYSNQDMLSKYIARTFIPHIIDNSTSYFNYDTNLSGEYTTLGSECLNVNFDIICKDLSNMVLKTFVDTSRTVQENSEDIWNFLDKCDTNRLFYDY